MLQIKFNFNNFARVCHSVPAAYTPSSLAAVIGLSNNDVISLCSFSLRKFVNSLACVAFGWKPRLRRTQSLKSEKKSTCRAN